MNVIQIAKDVVEKEISALEVLKDSFCEEFEKLVTILLKNHGKIVISGIGKSGHVARKIGSTLSSIGFVSVFMHPAEAGHGDLGLIAKDDIVILLSNSGETIEFNGIIAYCKKHGNTIVGITRALNSTIYKACDIKIFLPNVPEVSNLDIPTTSSTMMMVFGDALVIAIKCAAHFTERDYKKYHPHGIIGARLICIGELMHKGEKIPIIHQMASFFDLVLEITSKRLGCVIVVNDNQEVIGIITDGDLRRHIDLSFNDCIAADIMSSNPVVAHQDMLVSQALATMQLKSITQLIVIDSNNIPIGIIHIHDLIKI